MNDKEIKALNRITFIISLVVFISVIRSDEIKESKVISIERNNNTGVISESELTIDNNHVSNNIVRKLIKKNTK